MARAAKLPAPVWRRVSKLEWEGRAGKVTFTVRCRGWRRYRLAMDHPNPPIWDLESLGAAWEKAAEVADSGAYLDGELLYAPEVELDVPLRPIVPQPDPPESIRPCETCGGRSPWALVPIAYTEAWWQDSAAFWSCRLCGGWLGRLDGDG